MTRLANLAVLIALPGFAQQALTFEVASIKPSNPDTPGGMIRLMPGGGLNLTNIPLRNMITMAYDVRDFQVSGGPGWMGTERFDLTATADRVAAAGPDDFAKMTDAQRKTVREQTNERLRALLADRFKLIVHKEIKEQPIYVLVVSKSGAKLQEIKEAQAKMGMTTNRGRMQAYGVPLEMLAQSLSGTLGRPIMDKTALTGKYDFVLEWTPDLGTGSDAANAPAPSGPTIFTALQEQLGLRLEAQKGPVENIVIDRAEKPSEN
jgi:bla regulator protein BlaR1